MENKEKPLYQEKIKLGGHEYRIVNVSSRFFGPMYIVMKDGDYHANAPTPQLAIHEVMNSL